MKLLALVEALDHPSRRYRLDPYVERARADGWDVRVEVLPSGFVRRLLEFPRVRDADVVLVQRRLLAAPALAWLRLHARRLVFDVDDAVWLPDSFAGRTRSRTRQARWRGLLGRVDGVLAGNEYLAQAAAGGTTRAVPAGPVLRTVVPTCVTLPALPDTPPDPRPTAVWIGSRATLGYLQAAAGAWARVASRVPGFRLRVVADAAPVLPGVEVEHRPWSPQSEWPDLASAWVGLAPLPADPWTQGKCGLKLLQYGAAGLPAVASPVGVQTRQVLHGRTGLLAGDEDAMADGLVDLLSDPARARAWGVAARRHVETTWSHAAWYPAWKRFLEKVAEGPPTDLPDIG